MIEPVDNGVRVSYNTIDRDLTLFEIWRECHRLRATLLAVLLAFVGVGTAYAILARPVYRISATLIPAEGPPYAPGLGGSGALGDLASLTGVDFGNSEDHTPEAIALMKSRRFSVDFMRDRNLLPILFAGQWNAATKTWTERKWLVLPARPPTFAQAFDYFDQKVRMVSQDKKTRIVTLTIDWFDRAAAVDWANQLIRRLNEEMRARAIAESTASLEHLEQQISQTSIVALQTSLAQLIEAEVRRKTIASVRPDYVFRVIDPPAMPDEDDPEFPKKPLVMLISLLLGIFVSGAIAIVSAQIRRRHTHDQP